MTKINKRRSTPGKPKKAYFLDHGTESFDAKNRRQVQAMGQDKEFLDQSRAWAVRCLDQQYTHHFKWLGRPILQLPQDIVAMQELIWKVKPEVIVETGIARGGSVLFYASMLELIGSQGEVIGIDIALRKHNRAALMKHPVSRRIKIISGSSIDPAVAARARDHAAGKKTMVILDSNHSHAHVLEELKLYSGMVSKGSYLIVSDTWLEDFPPGYFPNRPWDKGNNPATATSEFLKSNRRFVRDVDLDHKLAITCCPGGYLKCVRR